MHLDVPNTTPSEHHKVLVYRFAEIINTGNIIAFADVISDKYVQHNPMVAQGLTGIQEAFKDFQQAFSPLEARVDTVIADGDEVVARFTWSGTHIGPFMGLQPTGKRVVWGSIDWWRVADGKLAEHWDQVDWYGLLAQLQPETRE